MSTETLTVEITPAQLKAAMLFVSDDATRPHLGVVRIEHGQKQTRMYATDGHRLICVKLDNGTTREQPLAYSVPRSVIESLVKGFGKLPAITFQWCKTDDGKASIKAGAIEVTEETGTYPDVSRVIPTTFSGETAQFDARYIADAYKAKELLTGARKNAQAILGIAHNGSSAALLDLGPDAFGVLMPMRADVPTLPAWFTEVQS
ncbi:MAG TPA: hypothetical protein VJP80_00220 [Candidatus Saccharimonadales bacterium]|nr:hypothetical protein [Candidatus Saccharimonadales bacterium]